jgi:hypothetical protein
MSTVADIMARALQESKVWPAVFRAGSAAEGAAAILSALEAGGFVVVPKEPTKEMSLAGFRANTFKNYHNGEPGCPGVASPKFPRDAFDADMTKVVDPDLLAKWQATPRCRIARVTMPADDAYRAMLAARPK